VLERILLQQGEKDFYYEERRSMIIVRPIHITIQTHIAHFFDERPKWQLWIRRQKKK
jgi:hypothetical protein